MSAYVIGLIDVHDPGGYPAYSQHVPTTLEPYGGQFLVRGASPWPWRARHRAGWWSSPFPLPSRPAPGTSPRGTRAFAPSGSRGRPATSSWFKA